MRKHAFSVLALSLMIILLISCKHGGNHEVATSAINGINKNEHNSAFDENGATTAVFSVSPTKKVRISRGNLQYQASTGTWRFAEQQYETIGEGNTNISATYDGWIDLFGWGTSGWNSGAKAYMPTSVSTDEADYIQVKNITGNYANADWGVYNAISNGGNKKGMWRLMTTEEFGYLCDGANYPDCSNHHNYKIIRIGDRYRGLIILPDDWNGPDVLNSKDTSYTIDQWKELERQGAVFFPATGYREGTSVYSITCSAPYWTISDTIDLVDNMEGTCPMVRNYFGYPARLVQDVK